MLNKYSFKRAFIFFAPILLTINLNTISIASEIPQPIRGDDGIYRHSWMTETFLDLKEDFQSAKSKGKRLVVFIEQKGCIYCQKIQTEILVIPRINKYCLLYTSPSPRDGLLSRMPSSA